MKMVELEMCLHFTDLYGGSLTYAYGSEDCDVQKTRDFLFHETIREEIRGDRKHRSLTLWRRKKNELMASTETIERDVQLRHLFPCICVFWCLGFRA